jgi:hypothetical protein
MGQQHLSIAEVQFDAVDDRMIGHHRMHRCWIGELVRAGPRQRLGVLRRTTPGQILSAAHMRPYRSRKKRCCAEAVVEMRVGKHHGARLPGHFAHCRVQLSTLFWITAGIHYQAAPAPDHQADG